MHFTEKADCKLSVSNGSVIASSYSLDFAADFTRYS